MSRPNAAASPYYLLLTRMVAPLHILFMKLHLLTISLTLSFVLQSPAKVAESGSEILKESVEWQNDAMCQFVFFAVLEGLYRDGIQNEIVDAIIGDRVEKERDKVLQELRVLELLVQQQESHLDTSQQEKLQKQAMLDDLKHQLEDLQQARHTVEQMQSQPKVIQHRPTPMAKTVFGTEIHFRLFQGRIAYIPWDQLIERLKQDAQQKARNLSGEGKLTELIGPIGGFRMRYQLGVRRYLANTTDGPRMRQGLQLEQFELIPVDPTMGEGVASAIEEGSRFLQTLGSFSSQRATVTIWVYPESFIQFQQIKTLLHQRGFACAGRPLPAGALISGSPSGSLSAAQ